MKTSKLEQLVGTPNVSEKKEPALVVGSATAGVAGIIVLILSTFFPKLVTEDVKTTIYGVVAILFPIIAGWITRGKVWSPASVEEVIEEAVKTKPGTTKLSKDFFQEDDGRKF